MGRLVIANRGRYKGHDERGEEPGRTIVRGAQANAAGFLLRFGGRLIFLFVAARLYGAHLYGAFVLAAALVELAVGDRRVGDEEDALSAARSRRGAAGAAARPHRDRRRVAGDWRPRSLLALALALGAWLLRAARTWRRRSS